MDKQRQDDQLESIYNSSVTIQDIGLKTRVAREDQGDQWLKSSYDDVVSTVDDSLTNGI